MIHLRAYAKINLDLRIIGKRDDGYHEIQTLMQTIDLWDDLKIQRSWRQGIQLRCVGLKGVPAGAENLAYRAADALLSSSIPNAGVTITIHKRIPMGAGLGGGSSDAAAVLRGINQLMKLRLSSHRLSSIASKLGSDIPYFLHGGLCAAFGRGISVRPIRATRRVPILLVIPFLHISTAEAYRWYAERRTGKSSSPIESNSRYLRKMEFAYRNGLWSSMKNELEAEALIHHSQLSAIKIMLYKNGAVHTQMTGSGSCIYGIFDSIQSLRNAANDVKHSGNKAKMIRFISRTAATSFAHKSFA